LRPEGNQVQDHPSLAIRCSRCSPEAHAVGGGWFPYGLQILESMGTFTVLVLFLFFPLRVFLNIMVIAGICKHHAEISARRSSRRHGLSGGGGKGQ
jgi:hypothetical protein